MIGIFAVTAVIIMLVRHRRRKAHVMYTQASETSQTTTSGSHTKPLVFYGSELQADSRPSELAENQQPQAFELPER